MKAAPFDSTPEFQHFKEVMRGVLAVPKKRLDELVRLAKENSPRNGYPHAPGQSARRNAGHNPLVSSQTKNAIPKAITGAHADGLPRLPRMSGPSKSDRETLGKRLKSRQFWAEIFGWLVGVGLLVEYWDEIIDCVIKRHWPSRPLAGGLLVTAGVLGEVLLSRLALIISDELQERADSDVSMANARAAEAIERATKGRAGSRRSQLGAHSV
jgi:hypothetical protein